MFGSTRGPNNWFIRRSQLLWLQRNTNHRDICYEDLIKSFARGCSDVRYCRAGSNFPLLRRSLNILEKEKYESRRSNHTLLELALLLSPCFFHLQSKVGFIPGFRGSNHRGWLNTRSCKIEKEKSFIDGQTRELMRLEVKRDRGEGKNVWIKRDRSTLERLDKNYNYRKL